LSSVLYVCHNHPHNRPGGAEIYALELYRAAREAGAFDPLLVAKSGPPFSDDQPHEGSPFSLIDGDPRQYHVYTDGDAYSRLFGTMRSKRFYTEDWRPFLDAYRPDLVHFQHTLFLGYDILRATRAALPDAPLVYTLHDFLPICHHNGQLVRVPSMQPCEFASPRRCHQCFPDIPAQTFFLRQTFIQAALELVDLFITPSEDARGRYIRWGLPADKIVHEDYGRIPVPALPDPPDAGKRRRIGFFGQITPFKGVDVLLKAMELLHDRDVDVELIVHAGNFEHQRESFREDIADLLERTSPNVNYVGSYPQRRLPALMSAVDWVVVPSIWWETGPLVIHEAMMHRRPVICSDIGAMPERITDGVNGLHFRARDPFRLADTIERAVTEPGLWQRLRAAITDPYPMSEHLEALTGLYARLLETERPVAA
jgi:glycosyltransferase involved in cell wall biosynthesis